jgi:hypothetical protein
LRTCKVLTWKKVGRGRYGRWQPQAWLVPRFRLGNITPLSDEEARTHREVASERARKSYWDRMQKISERIGAFSDSRTTRALAFGHIDEDLAELIAFKTRYRHEETNYDLLLRAGEEKEFARNLAEESEIPADWKEYLDHYGFASPQARAMATVLKNPQSAHPVWFKEAEIALRRSDRCLDTLSYDVIRRAIDAWRSEREDD